MHTAKPPPSQQPPLPSFFQLLLSEARESTSEKPFGPFIVPCRLEKGPGLRLYLTTIVLPVALIWGSELVLNGASEALFFPLHSCQSRQCFSSYFVSSCNNKKKMIFSPLFTIIYKKVNKSTASCHKWVSVEPSDLSLAQQRHQCPLWHQKRLAWVNAADPVAVSTSSLFPFPSSLSCPLISRLRSHSATFPSDHESSSLLRRRSEPSGLHDPTCAAWRAAWTCLLPA